MNRASPRGAPAPVPASNVSRHVAALERSLGVRLLERSTRHLRMTEAGRLLYQRAKPLLDTLATAEELGAGEQALRGPLRMCMPAKPAAAGPDHRGILRQPSGVELQCDTRMAGEQALREDMDLAIVFHRGDQEDSTLVTRELASLPSLIVAAPGLIARSGMPTRTAQLKTLPCITTLRRVADSPGVSWTPPDAW